MHDTRHHMYHITIMHPMTQPASHVAPRSSVSSSRIFIGRTVSSPPRCCMLLVLSLSLSPYMYVSIAAVAVAVDVVHTCSASSIHQGTHACTCVSPMHVACVSSIHTPVTHACIHDTRIHPPVTRPCICMSYVYLCMCSCIAIHVVPG